MSRLQYKSASPNKNFKTRTVYKNAKEEDTTGDLRSLYAVTIGKSNGNKMAQTQGNFSVSLADLGAMQRTNSQRSSLKGSSRLMQSQDLSKGGQQPQARRASDAKKLEPLKTPEKPQNAQAEKSAPPAKADHQCIYESELLKKTMKEKFGNNPYINIDNEAEYYEAVKRLDICGKCWAHQQKFYTNPFKIKHRGPGQSLYQKDYVKHPLNDQGPTLKNDFYTTFQNNEPMDFTTTMKNDFKDWKAGRPVRETMNWKPATTGIPFAGVSQYKQEYANWGANTTAYEKASQALTVIPELPFLSKTTYGDAFAMPEATQQLKPKDRDLWNKNKKPPITSAIPFLGESTHAATYKPFKVAPAPNFEVEEDYEPTECLPEHHRSLYARDFAPKANWVCPAIIFMEQNPHPKLKYLNA